MIRTIFCVLCFWAGSVYAEQTCPLNMAWLETEKSNPAYLDYRYKREIVSPRQQAVEAFDPSLPPDQRWQLLEIDQEPPDEETLTSYRENREETDEGFSVENLLSDVKPDSMQPLDASASEAYSFKLLAEDEEEDFMEQARGEIHFKDQGCGMLYKVINETPFSPMTGVKIKSFSMELALELDQNSGLLLPVEMTQTAKGRAFMVKKIDDVTKVRYYDFQKTTSP